MAGGGAYVLDPPGAEAGPCARMQFWVVTTTTIGDPSCIAPRNDDEDVCTAATVPTKPVAWDVCIPEP